jgi:hypothetical protein
VGLSAQSSLPLGNQGLKGAKRRASARVSLLADSLAVAEDAVALARACGSWATEVRALAASGADLAYLGRTDDGLARLRRALDLAEAHDDLVMPSGRR